MMMYSSNNQTATIAAKMNSTASSNMVAMASAEEYESRRKNNKSTNHSQTPVERGESAEEKETKQVIQKQKASFISAELAFSQEQKRLFDKIGYNKIHSKNQLGQARQRDQIIIQTIGKGSIQGSKGRRRNIVEHITNTNPNQTRNEDQQQEVEMLQPQIIQGLSSLALDEEKRFMRRQGKADETFYENRTFSLSKTRANRQQMFDEAMSQKRTASGSANVMKRLMIMRRIKQNSEGLFDDQQANTIETLNDESEITQNRKYRVSSPPYKDHSRDRKQKHQKREEELDLSGSRRDCTSLCSNDQSAGKNPLNRIGIQNQQFVSRWNNNQEFQKSITEKATAPALKDATSAFANHTFTYFNILPDTQKETSNDSRRINFQNQEEDEEQENFFYPQDENIYNELDTKSVISSGSMLNKLYNINSANAARKLQSNRIMDNINAIQMVPHVKGITKQQMIDLFNAKCHDLKITSSKNQMLRFFDTFVRNQGLRERRLNLSDSGIGDHSMKVVCQILKNNSSFAQLDLHKNAITNVGIRLLAKILKKNVSIVHLDIGCNQFTSEGACALFQSLFYNESVTSISLGNSDCYKNKNKIGVKGAMVLGELIAKNHLIQFFDLSDSNLSQESLSHLINGVKHNPYLVSLNLSHNDLGVGNSPYTPFNHLLSVFEPSKQSNKEQVSCHSLEELVLSDTNLCNKHLDEFGQLIKKCAKTRISRIDMSQNPKLSTKGALSLLTALRANLQIKLSHLNLDKANLSMGMQQEQITNFFEMLRVLAEYLRVGKSLKSLSLNGCQVSDDLMNGIGKGLAVNENLEHLSLRSNIISQIGLKDILSSLTDNHDLKLRYLDLSSNRLSDQAGQLLANALTHLPQLEQLYLRDNELAVEAGDALFFLAQQKKSLWRLQLEKNAIRYGTLVDIERECKRNRRNYYQGRQGHYLGIRQEISDLQQQSSSAVPYSLYHALTEQIVTQDTLIRQGQDYLHRQEEKVNILRATDQEMSVELETQLSELLAKKEALDSESSQLSSEMNSREKEWLRKIEFETSLLERQREYVASELGKRVEEERKKVAVKRAHRRVDEESEKLRHVLEKAEREAQLMAMIADNYQKEINRRKAEANSEEQVSQRQGVQSANMVLFFTKKIHQMVSEEKEEGTMDEKKGRKNNEEGRKTPKIVNQKRGKRSNERPTKAGGKMKPSEQKVKMIANLKEAQNSTQLQ